MDEQLTLRLPRDLARALRRYAKGHGVARSQVVREAIQAYLAAATAPGAEAAWQGLAPLVGSVRLDPAAIEQDTLARRIRSQNWRP